MIWNLPYATHTRFLESLSPVPHLESVLAGRYIGFLQSAHSSNKSVIKLLSFSCSSNLRSQTGSNIYYLMKQHSKFSLGDLFAEKNVLKKKRIYELEDEKWKINLVEEISLVRKEHLELEYEVKDLEDILHLVCTC